MYWYIFIIRASIVIRTGCLILLMADGRYMYIIMSIFTGCEDARCVWASNIGCFCGKSNPVCTIWWAGGGLENLHSYVTQHRAKKAQTNSICLRKVKQCLLLVDYNFPSYTLIYLDLVVTWLLAIVSLTLHVDLPVVISKLNYVASSFRCLIVGVCTMETLE